MASNTTMSSIVESGDQVLSASGVVVNADKMRPTVEPRILVLPYPSQSHINPMLQFAKHLVAKSLKVSLVTTHFIINSTKTDLSSVELLPISDGYDEGGVAAAPDLNAYLRSLEDFGSKSLSELIGWHASTRMPFTCIVFDTYMPWAVSVARMAGLTIVAFSTQSAAASSIYYHVNKGTMEAPMSSLESEPAFGLPPMHRRDFPSMALGDGAYPTLSMLALGQFRNLEAADWVLVNTFEELEIQVISALKEHWNVRAIGPTVPPKLINTSTGDDDHDYGLNLLQPQETTCIRWLSGCPSRSVVYVSFGSYALLSANQMEELASALLSSPFHFLWVVRASELDKLPMDFEAAVAGKGLVVTWSPQLAVLLHPATGCFVTHCGWNSTLEALSVGMPMVAVPQWTDQPTNAKYVEEVWGVGVRARAGESGLVTREELERCTGEVMGSKKEEIWSNASRWKESVKMALSEGGSSDENLNDFVRFLGANVGEAKQLE